MRVLKTAVLTNLQKKITTGVLHIVRLKCRKEYRDSVNLEGRQAALQDMDGFLRTVVHEKEAMLRTLYLAPHLQYLTP